MIAKRRDREVPFVYSTSPQVVFGEKYSLTILSVTPEDAGSYECTIHANIGGQNRNTKVDLVVNGELPVYFACQDLHKSLDSVCFQSKHPQKQNILR